MTERVNFTKAYLSKLRAPRGKSRHYVHDAKVIGLCVCVTSTGTKSFQVYRKLHGKPKRITLGRFPDLPLAKARELAVLRLADIASGIDPNQQARAHRVKGVTLQQCFNDYMEVRGQLLAENTRKRYDALLRIQLGSLREKPLREISRDSVASLHRRLSKASPTTANHSMRLLRALFNFANGQYEDEHARGLFPENPVTRLTHTRAWNVENRRQTIIKRTQLEAWFQAVREIGNQDELYNTVADYLVFTLLHGLRRREASHLTIDAVDLSEKTFELRRTKNRKPIVLPLTHYTEQLLRRQIAGRTDGYVFLGRDGSALNDPRAAVRRIRELSGVNFTIHDLRRTFITIAESLDISAYALKRLVNHSLGQDVTAGYIIMDVERLRKPSEAIASYILRCGNVITAPVTSLVALRGVSNASI